MKTYWFWRWLKRHRVKDGESLRRALNSPRTLDALLDGAPERMLPSRQGAPEFAELTGGKGIDLTGNLGCRHIDCLTKEIDGLFRHAWHYFDVISLPDQALDQVMNFECHRDVDTLRRGLEPFVLVLHRLDSFGGLDLVRFDVRRPPCSEHYEQHADEAKIRHTLTNIPTLVSEVLRTAEILYEKNITDGHRHVDYSLESDLFEHTEFGSLCSNKESIPKAPASIRESIATSVVRKYLAAISADAFAARSTCSPLGATIPFYRRLLARQLSPTVDDVAFELALPVNSSASAESLVRLRRDEEDAFRRLQLALRKAIGERLKSSGSPTAGAIAKELKRDLVDPELRNIATKLRTSRSFALRSAGSGIALGTVAVSVGLLAPLSQPLGLGLIVGGAIALAAQALKKANDDELAVLRDVELSDMYFLWRAHKH